ncbi:peptidase M15 [Candidatus Microgenomates bacterium]|nr:MAG: peptidase M15 [Candidatus Microgenomates bacterium]
MTYLTKNFPLAEFCFSETAERHGIVNELPPELLLNAKRMCEYMEEVRAILGHKPITCTSGYRNPQVNRLVRGSKTSAHMKALAMDFRCYKYGTPFQIAEVLASVLVDFDQLIYEGTWVHLGLAQGFQRRQIKTAKFSTGKAVYYPGIVP